MPFLICKECVVCKGHHFVSELGHYNTLESAQSAAVRLNQSISQILQTSIAPYKVVVADRDADLVLTILH